MNRSILIVICDFLLVSLLAFSTVDVNSLSNPGAPRALSLNLNGHTNQVDARGDLASAMQVALNEERRSHEQLQAELAQARANTTEREQQVQSVQQQLKAREQTAALLVQQQTALQQQYVAATNNVQLLAQQLQNSSSQAALSHDLIEQFKSDSQKQSEQAAALRKQLDDLTRSNALVLADQQRLASQLQLAEANSRSAHDEAARMAEEVKVERAEKAKLASGVESLAAKSSQLAQEIRENTPLAPNTIFDQFVSNRVEATFAATKPGVFGGQSVKRATTESVLVTDGTNIFALCHVDSTPLALRTPGTDWDGLSGSLGHGPWVFPIHSLSLAWPDPRIALIPVSTSDARQLGCRVYKVSPTPFKFQDAVLVGAQGDYYGQCSFEIDTTTPDYVKLDRSVLKGLFGKFNPSRGDLVFSRTGELLGVMANDTYCVMVRGLDASATLQFGPNLREQHTGQLLSQLSAQVMQMPFKLQ